MTTDKATTTETEPQTEPQALAKQARLIHDVLAERTPHVVENVPPELHEMPPFLAKKDFWNPLGDLLKLAEKPPCDSIPGQYWISLRCDGTGFSKFTKQLRRLGVFPESGYSPEFASIMRTSCQELMTKFNAKCGYTQSDELTVLIPPANVVRGEQQPHCYNGRVQKLCSLAAATVTAHFNHELAKLFQQYTRATTTTTTVKEREETALPAMMLATFDCRVGMYETQQEAVSLLLWRAYDCGINGVSDAVYHCKGQIEGAGPTVKLPHDQKLKWLHQQEGLLPLPDHQRAGSYFVRRKRLQTAENPLGQKSKQQADGDEPASLCLRSKLEHVPGNVLLLCKHEQLFPPDEVLP